MNKLALDVSDIDSLPGNSGSFGIFKTNFPPEIKKKIKDQLGNANDNIGIKKFFTSPQGHPTDIFDANLIEENLALVYFAPYIRQNTTFKTPSVANTLPLSAIIKQRINVTEKMPGKSLGDYNKSRKLNRDIMDCIENTTSNSIFDQLLDIGIYWADCKFKNYLVDEKNLKEALQKIMTMPRPQLMKLLRKTAHPIGSIFDVSKGASLFDFGLMSVQRGRPPGQKLIEFQKLCQGNNKYFQTINQAIENILE